MSAHHLAAYYPHHALMGGTGAYTCISVCGSLAGPGLSVELHALSSAPDARFPWLRAAIPAWSTGLAYRLDPNARWGRLALRRQFQEALRRSTIAYLWAATPLETYADVKAAGVPLVVERINCHRETALPILDEAYRRAGVEPAHGITAAAVQEERLKLGLADWIFAANPWAARSIVESGVSTEKVLLSSYGWSAARVQMTPRSRPDDAPLRVLFVGTVCIRKGAHLLLDAWERSQIPGELVLCGQILPEMVKAGAGRLGAPSVRTLGHVANIAQAYSDADLFAFPTLEEGGPLVILEAMARGLPILTSPMGAGNVLRDGVDGIVRDPYDIHAWETELRRLASDPELRARLGRAAAERAREYTWHKVGARRRELLLMAIARGRHGGKS